MTVDVRALLAPHGVVRAHDLAGLVDRHTLGRRVRAGELVRPFPGVLVAADRVHDWDARALAAVHRTGGALSHFTALAVWLRAPREGVVHVSVPVARRAPRRPGLVVHRVRELSADRLGPFPVTHLPRALVDTWGWAHRTAGTRREVELARAAVIGALRDRQVRPAELRREMAAHTRLPGTAGLRRLIELVEGGCQSELEIWGVLEVLRGPGMPRFVQQHRVALSHAVVHLDAAVLEVRVAVELDGAAFHGSAADRERDTRRDVALAALGWVVLRFSYRRLREDPEGCRRQILAVCRARAMRR